MKRKLIKNQYLKVQLSDKKEKILLLIILLLSLMLRYLLAFYNKGLEIDMNCFRSWANVAANNGLSNFYTSNMFVDYPPGYIYILYFIGKIQLIFGFPLDSTFMNILLKSPAIFADIISSYMIYSIAKKKFKNATALVLCLIYAMNPAIIFNSAVWGQVDSFFTLFIILMLFNITKGNLITASLTFTLATLIKPQAFIFTPILIFAFYERKDVKLLIKSSIYSLVFLVILILPFSLKQNIFWIVEKYAKTLSSYPYSSVNAFNLYSFLDANWTSINNKLLFIPYKIYGTIFILAIVAFSTYVFLKSKYKFKLYYIAFFIISSVFILTTKMHERYMFPAVSLSLLWYVFSKDKRAIWSFAITSVTHFINVAYVFVSIGKRVFQIPNDNFIMVITSFVNVVFIMYIVKVGFDYSENKPFNKDMIIKEHKENINNINKNQVLNNLKYNTIVNLKEKIVFSKKDYILISILIVIYSTIAFINLGSTKVPQKFWQPSEVGESFYIDFGEEKQINKISYYCGLGEGSYNITFSSDSLNFSNEILLNQKNIYNWDYVGLSQKARYAKITVVKSGGMLNEIGFSAIGNKEPIDIKGVKSIKINSKDKGKPEMVFDEQETVELSPSYLTGMIFDEIYHARTAYEQLNQMGMYEWTHPPLGKLLISLGISVFGMNPLGWRIVGTLFGIAMIPLMYFFAKRLFKKTEYAFLAAFSITFDFMHFTQTRIATIDVFAVFFIMLMYYYMFKFLETNLYRDERNKSYIALGFSGVFFSLGIATKWICIYAGVGLAILLFKELIDRFKQYKFSKDFINKQNDNSEDENYKLFKHIVVNYKDIQIKTLVICLVFFILLPVVVYICSYIPFMMIPGNGHGLKEVIDYQIRMFNYHSTLKETHFFESPWWQWPIIKKPMWYYTGQQFLPNGKISSIVCMGNPAIWWVGMIAAVATLVIGVRKKDRFSFVILVGGLSQFLPWVLVPRLTFIYHYFATVPFIILCIVYVISYFNERYSKTKYYVYGFMGVVVLLFVLFYPVISGMVIDKSFAEKYLRWFNTWYFYN